MLLRFIGTVGAGAITTLPIPIAHAIEPPPPAYQLAAYSEGVPSTVLYAVALQESGVRLASGTRPWPWTLNVAGEGHFFRDRHSACSALTLAIASVGAKRVDVGIGQINLGWNGLHFANPCDALDPYQNLQVTARLLRTHFESTGDWVAAAGRYHRPAGGAPAANYRLAFARHVSRVMNVPSKDVSQALGILWVSK